MQYLEQIQCVCVFGGGGGYLSSCLPAHSGSEVEESELRWQKIVHPSPIFLNHLQDNRRHRHIYVHCVYIPLLCTY